MASSQMYSSLHAAQDVARGACIVAWPADEPYSEPTNIAQIPRQSRLDATANSTTNTAAAAAGNTIQASTPCPSFASWTSMSQTGRSERSLSLSGNSDRSRCDGLV